MCLKLALFLEIFFLLIHTHSYQLNLKDKKDDIIFKNKFTNNLEIFFLDKIIYLKDNKSLLKLSE